MNLNSMIEYIWWIFMIILVITNNSTYILNICMVFLGFITKLRLEQELRLQ